MKNLPDELIVFLLQLNYQSSINSSFRELDNICEIEMVTNKKLQNSLQNNKIFLQTYLQLKQSNIKFALLAVLAIAQIISTKTLELEKLTSYYAESITKTGVAMPESICKFKDVINALENIT